MANYSKNLTERFSNRGPKIGYCAICRKHGPLTVDHVPPKNCGNINDSIFTNIYGPSRERPYKPVMSQGGSHFRTICAYCNNTILGTEYDPALRDAVRQIEAYFSLASHSRLSLPRTQLFDYQPNRFLRAVVGHLLAANGVPDVLATDPVAPLDDALRKYVLDPAQSLPEGLCVYYWFYPHRRRIVMKHSLMGFMGGNGAHVYGHVFKFFPFGFWFVWNENGGRSDQFGLRRLGDSSLAISTTSRLALDLWPLQPMNFPEAPSNDSMWLTADPYVSQADDRDKQSNATKVQDST
ncbi:TPA: hypothetical protein U2L31_000211 [Burkholderia contaminans]|nr:hypothetical protein [Burkholderia contaminans]